MNIQSLGDLAQTFKLRQQNAQIKQQMARLTEELSSGRTADISKHLAGNFGHLSDIEHDLVVLERYRVAVNEVTATTDVMQSALDTVQRVTQELGANAAITSSTAGNFTVQSVAYEGRGAMNSIISALNVNVAGRALFSGTETENIPLASDTDLLNELRIAAAAATTAADVIAALDTFFDTAGGGFETLIYQGGDTYLSPTQLGEGESVQLNLRADDRVFREALKNTAMAALADDGSIPLTSGERVALAQQAGERLLTSQDGLILIRSDLGYAQSRIDQAKTRIASETSSLEFARNRLVSIDQFQTATELENVQIQLETLYTLTARTSRLSLVNFLS